jgi:ribonuclease J
LKTSQNLIAESEAIVTKVVQNNLDNKEFDWGHLKQDVRDHLNHYLYEQTKRHPVILPIIMETNQHHRRVSKKLLKTTPKNKKATDSE